MNARTPGILGRPLALAVALSFGIASGPARGDFTVTQSDAAPATNIAISQSDSDFNFPWRHNQQVGVDRNPRDAGQTFFVDAAAYPDGLDLDTITVRINPLATSGYDGDGFTVAIYDFTDATDVIPDPDLNTPIFTEPGNLPAAFKADYDAGNEYLTIDLTDVTLQGGRQYGFLLMLDAPSEVGDNMLLAAKGNSTFTDGVGLGREQRGTGSDNIFEAAVWTGSELQNADLEFYLQGHNTDTIDTDNDGLLDAFEQAIIDFDPNDSVDGLEDVKGPNDAPDTSDFDNDGSSDAAEAARGTDPTDDDSDDDGLKDGVEDDTGIFVDADLTGTDPLDDDSDDDGLLDGVETGTMVFNGPTDTGSDPNKLDSDGDGFDDKTEVDANSDPSNPAATPPLPDIGMSDSPPTENVVISQSESDWNIPWRHNQQVGVDRNPRDLGQTFLVNESFTLDAVTVRVDVLATNGYDGDPFTLVVYEFTDATDIEPDPDADFPIHTTTENLPATFKDDFDAGRNYLRIDVPEVELDGGKQYGFLLMFDEPSDVPDNLLLAAKANSAYADGISLQRQERGTAGDNFREGMIWDGNQAQPADLEFYLQGSAGRRQLAVTHDPGTGNLSISWSSQAGMLYNLRSETDPASKSDSGGWPIFEGNEDILATPPVNTLTFPLPADPFRLFVVESFPPPPVTALADDFESGQGEWTAGSEGVAETAWELGTPSNVGPVPPGIPLPSPSNCFGTNIGDNYGPDSEIWLRTPELDLTSFTRGATLSFQHFKDIEEGFDFGAIRLLRASNDGELAVLEMTIDGTSAGWEPYSKALPAEAFSEPIKIEFRFNSDDIENFPGWYIDDVEVIGRP